MNSCQAAGLDDYDTSLRASSEALNICGLIDEKLSLSILVHYQNVSFWRWASHMVGSVVTSPNQNKSADYDDLSINHG